MKVERESRREGKKISLVNKIFIIYMCVLMLALSAVNIIDRCGYALKRRETSMFGLLLVVVSAVVWISITIFRRIKSKNGRMLGGIIMVFIVFILGIAGLTYVGQFAQLIYPAPYSMIESAETGNKAVVLRGVDAGMTEEDGFEKMMERMEARYAEISDEPVSEETGYPIEAYGYAITAYPEKMGIFYHLNADVEGQIYLGYASEAKLLYEWLDGDTLRLYLDNPEVGDSGEILIRF